MTAQKKAELNKFDKAIQAVAPGWALKRQIARNDLGVIESWSMGGSAYSSGDPDSRKRKSAAFGRSRRSTEETATGSHGYDAMRLEAMDLYRNNPIARSIVETARRYCRPSQPRASTMAILEKEGRSAEDIAYAKEYDEAATDYFNGYWWPRADYQRRPGVTFGTLQDMFITLQFVQGDLAYVWTGDGFLTVEGMQIRTPTGMRAADNIRNGFRFDENGRITHIYVCDYDDNTGYSSNKFTRYNIASVIFCPWYWRASQLRGVPRLHGVIDNLRDQEEIHDATKQKVKNEAMILSIERAGSRKKAPGSSITNEDGTTTTYEKADWGMRFKTSGSPKDDFTFANADSPNAQYVPLMEHDQKIISSGAGIPYKVLMSLYDGSFSANKGAQAALKIFINELWVNRRDVFTQRAYNIIIAQGIRGGHIPAPPIDKRGVSLFNRAEWTKPYFPQLDQQKEEAGRQASFQNFTSGPDDWADEQGTTSEDLYQNHKTAMKRLQADAKELGMSLNEYAGGLLAKNTSISSNSTGINDDTNGENL